MKKIQYFSWFLMVGNFMFLSCMNHSDVTQQSENNPLRRVKKASGDYICKPVTTDWWSVACSGDICYWQYMYSVTTDQCSYSTNSGIPSGMLSGGGNASMFDGGNQVGYSASDERLNKISLTNSMNVNQKNMLKEALNDFINKCLQKAVYNQIAANNKRFNFTMNSTSGAAAFNPYNNTISFSSDIYINEASLTEELFHGYQDSHYPGGISQYLSTARASIEFEAKVYKDIMTMFSVTGGPIYGVPAGNSSHDDYYLWLIEITDGGTKYPTVIPIDKYQEFREAFRVSYPEYNTPNNESIFPDALISLINSSDCPK